LKKDVDQDEEVFDALKRFIIKYSAHDYLSHPLLKYLYKYLLEIYRKLNLRTTMNATLDKIHDLMPQTNEVENSLKAKKEELLQKLAGNKGMLKDLDGVISTTEISNVRSAQIINSITDISATAKAKLEKTQERVNNILGDCIQLAISIVYLGIFNMRERISFRKSLKETLKGFNITCSTEWAYEDPQKHCMIFKEI
jgi:hypothetical protein